MTRDQLRERIWALPIGGVQALTRAQFDLSFPAGTLEEGKRAAIALAEICGCAARFTGRDDPFVSFTRRQERTDLRTSPRWPPAPYG